MGLFDAQNDTLNLDPKAVQQSLSRLNSMRPAAPPAPPAPKERGLFGETAAAVKRGGLQVVDMAGNIAKAIDPEGGVDVVRNTGAGLSNFARNRAAQPDVAESMIRLH